MSEIRAILNSHLAGLPKDRRGRPMPYVNMYGPDGDAAVYLKEDPVVGGRMSAFYRDRGDELNFARQSLQRQRECMVKGLCQVCARALTWPERCLITSPATTGTVELSGVTVPATTEPWLCTACAGIAMQFCPELIRRRRGDELILLTGLTPAVCSLLITVEWVEGRFEAYTRDNPVVTYVKLAFAAQEAVKPLLPDQGKQKPTRIVPF